MGTYRRRVVSVCGVAGLLAYVILIAFLFHVGERNRASRGEVSRVPQTEREPSSSQPPPQAEAGSTWTNPVDGAEMVFVPAGEFLMGSADSDKAAQPDEKPQFRTSLPDY